MFYVYGLICNDGSLYIGSTNSLQRRFVEHNQGVCRWTRIRLPVKLDFYVAVTREETARSLEKYFKTGSGKAVVRKRILSDEAL